MAQLETFSTVGLDARRKLEDAQNEEMKGLSGGLGILPGFKMPF